MWLDRLPKRNARRHRRRAFRHEVLAERDQADWRFEAACLPRSVITS